MVLTAARAFEHNLIVKAQSEFWHTRQVALHFDSAENFRAHDISVCIDLGCCEPSEPILADVTYKHVDTLDNVQEDFVFPISDSFCAPRDGICDRRRWSGLDLKFV